MGQPAVERPDPERVIAGDPVFRTWDTKVEGGLHTGIWEATPGTWRVSYDEWEYCRILAGRSIITGDDGTVMKVGPGDSFAIPRGFKGRWEVVETTRKEYVIRL